METVTALLAHRPDLAVVLLLPAAVCAHALVRGLRHRVRLHLVRWRELGTLVELDLANPRALAVQVAFLLTLTTGLLPEDGLRWPFAVALVALVAACCWAALPIVREITREVVELASDAAAPAELGSANL